MSANTVRTITREHIISLIKDDLINYKLVSSLNDMGLDAHNYFLHLSETIFELMGFGKDTSDDIFESYMKYLKKVKRLNIKRSHVSLDALAKKIYEDLHYKNR